MNRLLILVVLAFAIYCYSTPLIGQLSGSIEFKQLDVDRGLSQNSVISIAQDSIGYLWFATQDGLNRYSGKFEIYQKQFEDITKPKFHELGKIFCDSSGRIWCISKNDGLEYFDEASKSFTSFTKIKNASLINQDAQGIFWITTKDGLVLRTSVDFDAIDTMYSNPAMQYFDLKNIGQQMFLATSDGVIVFDSSEQNKSDFSRILKGSSISSIDVSKDDIYLGTFGSGLYNYNHFTGRLSKPIFDFDNIVIYKVLCDTKGRIWLGTYGQGVFVIDDGNVKNFKPQINGFGTISYHDILDIYQDISGVVWIGTDGGGVNYYDEYIQKFRSQTIQSVSPVVNIDVVRSIYSDDAFIYCGTSGKGLTVYNRKKDFWKTYKTANGLTSDRIMAIQKDSDGDLWLGNQLDGLSILGSVNRKDFNVKSFLPNMSIWCFANNMSNQFWCGTQQSGLILFDKNKGVVSQTNIYNSAGQKVSIRSIVKIDEKKLFIGTDNDGVFHFDIAKGTWQAIDFDMISINKIKALFYHNDRLFVCSNGMGLYVVDGQTLKLLQHLDTSSGLTNNVVYGMCHGSQDDFWISTNKGISKLESQSDTLIVKRHFNLEDGLQSYEFNTGAYFKSDDGYIYFGGINGINWFHPDSIPINNVAPKTIISSIEIAGEKSKNLNPEIVIPHDKNNFTVSLATSQLSLPIKNRFKYRLKDFQEEWQYTDSNFISYMNVDAGRYTLEVMGANYDGVWSNCTVEQVFIIQQVWYLSWWFKLLVLTVLTYLLFVIYKSKKRRLLLLHNAEQQKLKVDYLQSISDTRSRLFTNITHELLTPLTVIRGLSGRIEGNDKLKIKISNNSNHLIELVNQVLLISKSEVGVLKHEPYLMNVIPYFKYICDSFNSIANDKYISLNFYSEIDDFVMDLDTEKVKTVLGNIIMNAIKYTPMYGKVIVVVKRRSEKISISVIDNGIGMNEVTQNNIFDRFYQSGQLSEGGAGVGLSIVKELCSIIDVEINVTSAMGEGTQFELIFNVTADAEPISDNFSTINSIGHINDDETKAELSQAMASSARTVLLVEDNNDVADYIMQVLSFSYNCMHVKNGREALDYAQSQIPDIILTDMMMPIMDGIDLIRILRSEVSTNHIPIIVLTAKNTEQDKLIAIQLGADAYLTKPFSEAELLIRIDALIASQERKQLHVNSIQNPHENNPTVESNTFLKAIIDTINLNISNDSLSIQELCDAVNLERTQVYRKLKAMTGKSASQLIKEVRLEKAMSLIKEQDLTISQIAYNCGYKDVSYFSKSFKKHFGKRPSDF